jgi:hypothetical protein
VKRKKVAKERVPSLGLVIDSAQMAKFLVLQGTCGAAWFMARTWPSQEKSNTTSLVGLD